MKTMTGATLSALMAIATTADARTIFVSNEKGNSISIIDGDTLELVKEVPVGQRTDAGPHETAHGVPDRLAHPAHLPVAAFRQREAQPAVGYILAVADWHRARRQIGGLRQELHLRGACPPAFDVHPIPQGLQRRRIGDALHLHEVRARMGIARGHQARFERVVIGQKEQALTVIIQPSGGVDLRHVDIIGQRGAAFPVGELGQDVVGFPESKDRHQTAAASIAKNRILMHTYRP